MNTSHKTELQFEELFEMNKKHLFLTAYFLVKNKQDAEDIVQDVAIAAYSAFTTLKDIHSFKPWITKILVNRCKRVRFNIFKRNETSLLDDRLWENNISDTSIMVREALTKLPYNQRLLIILRYFNDLPVYEIAHILNVSEGTIKSRLHRTLAKLKLMINEG